jgi:hypothetical protein
MNKFKNDLKTSFDVLSLEARHYIPQAKEVPCLLKKSDVENECELDAWELRRIGKVCLLAAQSQLEMAFKRPLPVVKEFKVNFGASFARFFFIGR